MKDKILLLLAALLLVCIVVVVYKTQTYKANISAQWPEFDKWYKWKISTNLPDNQKSVVMYLQASSAIFNDAFQTQCVYPDSKYGLRDIEKAIQTVKNAIADLEKMPYPEECARYKKLCIENLKYILKYHQLRLDYGDGTKEFERKHRDFELGFIRSGVDSAKFSEYFNCMKRVGLFNHIEEESRHLGLVDKTSKR